MSHGTDEISVKLAFHRTWASQLVGRLIFAGRMPDSLNGSNLDGRVMAPDRAVDGSNEGNLYGG